MTTSAHGGWVCISRGTETSASNWQVSSRSVSRRGGGDKACPENTFPRKKGGPIAVANECWAFQSWGVGTGHGTTASMRIPRSYRVAAYRSICRAISLLCQPANCIDTIPVHARARPRDWRIAAECRQMPLPWRPAALSRSCRNRLSILFMGLTTHERDTNNGHALNRQASARPNPAPRRKR
jgi:hypothetical protein